MKKFFCCVKKQQQHESSCIKLEKEEFVISNMSWPLHETKDALSKSAFINIPN